MQRALRPYAAVGVALATASVIAATPAIAPPTPIQTRAVQMTALDDPIEVFAPVFDQASTVLQNVVKAEIAAPFPIVNAIIGKTAADAQTLGGLANQVAQSVATIGTTLPPALQTALQRLAAGDFNGYVGAFTPVFMGPLLTFQMRYFDAINWVRTQFTIGGEVARLALLLPNSLTVGQALNLLGPINAVTNTLTELAQVAIPSGDPAQIANTIQHGIANISIAGLAFADNWKRSLDSSRSRIAKALKPPTSVTAVSSTAISEAETPVAVSEESTPNADKTLSAPTEDVAVEVVKTKTKLATKAISHTDARKAATNNARGAAKNISAGFKKATDGLKKAAESLGGKKAEKPNADSDS